MVVALLEDTTISQEFQVQCKFMARPWPQDPQILFIGSLPGYDRIDFMKKKMGGSAGGARRGPARWVWWSVVERPAGVEGLALFSLGRREG